MPARSRARPPIRAAPQRTRDAPLRPVLAAALALALALVALAPPATAHSAAEPLSIEVKVLQDEGSDEFYWYDGYDLWYLLVREAYLVEEGREGLMFRFELYGGFGPGPDAGPEGAERMVVDVGLSAGPDDRSRWWRFSTTDDAEWEGNATIHQVNVTEDQLPWTGVTARLQAFVSYAELGAGPGSEVGAFWMRSWADDDLRDVAPGGVPVPGTNGAAVAPSESGRPNETLALQGPVGYVDLAVELDGWNVTVTAANPFEDQGQHVVVRTVPTPGWDVSARGDGRLVASLDGGQQAVFELTARPAPDATEPLPLEIVTDVGGRERLYLGVDGGADLTVGPDASALSVDPPAPAAGEATPGPGLWAAVAALAAALLLARRRRR